MQNRSERRGMAAAAGFAIVEVVVVGRVLVVPTTTTTLGQVVRSSSRHLCRRWAGEAAPSRREACATTTPRCSSAIPPNSCEGVAREASSLGGR